MVYTDAHSCKIVAGTFKVGSEMNVARSLCTPSDVAVECLINGERVWIEKIDVDTVRSVLTAKGVR